MSANAIDWPALLALEGQATAGPWWVDVGDAVTSVEAKHWTIAADVTNFDAAFIAAARTAVPALVALVRGLAGALEEIRETNMATYDGPWNAHEVAVAALATIPAALRAGVGE